MTSNNTSTIVSPASNGKHSLNRRLTTAPMMDNRSVEIKDQQKQYQSYRWFNYRDGTRTTIT